MARGRVCKEQPAVRPMKQSLADGTIHVTLSLAEQLYYEASATPGVHL
jgi:hypothetical protein